MEATIANLLEPGETIVVGNNGAPPATHGALSLPVSKIYCLGYLKDLWPKPGRSLAGCHPHPPGC